MSAEHLEEFLEKSALTGLQKAELKAVPDKVRYYGENKAIESYKQFHITFSKNTIFIIEPIKAKFAAVDDMLKEAIIERQVEPHKFDTGVILSGRSRAAMEFPRQQRRGSVIFHKFRRPCENGSV